MEWIIITCVAVIAVYTTSKASAIECHSCIHAEYSSSDINVRTANQMSDDPDCDKHGSDYKKKRTIECPYQCAKETGEVSVTYLGDTVSVKFVARGCSIISIKDGCIDHDDDQIEALLESWFGPGVRVDSEDYQTCYCSEDLCNHGNIIKGKLMAVISVIFMMLLLQM